MTVVTLVIGGSADQREKAIAAALTSGASTAIILEGAPGSTKALPARSDSGSLRVAWIAPGCPCCTGNLTMRVTLNRFLRPAPAHLYISLATTVHIEQVRRFLTTPPYEKLIALTKDISL